MRVCALALCALLFSGCALFSSEDGTEPMELVDFDSTAKVDVVWRAGVGSGLAGGVYKLQPALDGDVIYAADSTGRIVALERESGKRVWRQRTGDEITGGVSSNEGILLYGTGNGEVVALSNSDGEELWRVSLGGEVISLPRTDGRLVAVQTMDGRLHALDAQDGATRWHYDNPPPVLTLRGTASPTITDSLIISGFANGKVVAFNRSNGLVQWERRVALPQGRSEIERMVDIDASPLLVDDIVYAASFQGKAMALNRSNGRVRWEHDVSTHKDLAVSDRTLFISEANGRVLALSTSSGDRRWENEQLLRREIGGPQLIGDYLAVGDQDGYLHIMNRTDGEFAARRRLDRRGLSNTMVTDGDRLYILGDSGRMTAVRVRADD